MLSIGAFSLSVDHKFRVINLQLNYNFHDPPPPIMFIEFNK